MIVLSVAHHRNPSLKCQPTLSQSPRRSCPHLPVFFFIVFAFVFFIVSHFTQYSSPIASPRPLQASLSPPFTRSFLCLTYAENRTSGSICAWCRLPHSLVDNDGYFFLHTHTGLCEEQSNRINKLGDTSRSSTVQHTRTRLPQKPFRLPRKKKDRKCIREEERQQRLSLDCANTHTHTEKNTTCCRAAPLTSSANVQEDEAAVNDP